MVTVGLGSLVESDSAFKGIGKIVSIDSANQLVTVGFFTSPLNPYDNQIEVPVVSLKAKSKLQEQTVIYCRIGNNQDWIMGYYDGERPNNEHLIKFNAKESTVLELGDLFIPNIPSDQFFNPVDFLASKATSAPFLYESRSNFYQAYIEQRASCASLSSISSSAVNLETHQLAVVMQVLNDKNQKYLLGDEVGLGKTIEAGFLIKEHILEHKENACVFVLVPESLVEQWNKELKIKFHLAEVIDECIEESDRKIFIGCYKDILKFNSKVASMVVVDEAHQLGALAWDARVTQTFLFNQIAESCHQSTATLLLSGTPISGNTKNYLSMLHCLNPEGFEISEEGILEFEDKVRQRDQLAGIYTSFKASNDNETIEGNIDQIESMGINDTKLTPLLEDVRECVDFFAEDVEPKVREGAINRFREYFGEKYSLSKRFIRTRRDAKNSLVEGLFPGLGKYEYINLVHNSEVLSLDELLEEYRILSTPSLPLIGLDEQSFSVWLEALSTSPLSVSNLAQKTLLDEGVSSDEYSVLKQMVENAPAEQNAKDIALFDTVESWLTENENKNGKIVVFCGDTSVANHAYKFLSSKLSYVERHEEGGAPSFLTTPSIKVLVCDHNGEDGLNLQGERRLAIHYSLPTNITRIEQRIGRLNRYSATHRNYSPVENKMFTYQHAGYTKGWSELLINGVELFSYNRASVQLILDDYFSANASDLWSNGFYQYEKMSQSLSGEDGLIKKELKNIRNQELWNDTRFGVDELKSFSKKLKKSDESSEEQFKQMSNWIKGGLLFDVKRDEERNFVYQYQLNRTRINIDDFLKHCLLGMDFDSGFTNPSTKAMNENRDICAETGSFPFRYGQPFVDTIYEFSNLSSIGLSNALIRVLNTPFKKPMLMFKFNWLVEFENKSKSRTEQRNNDLAKPPEVISLWLNSEGNIEERAPLVDLLNKPYQQSLTSTGNMYQDFHVKNGVEKNVWEAVDGLLGEENWEDMVNSVSQSAQNILNHKLSVQEYCDKTFKNKLLSVQFVALAGN